MSVDVSEVILDEIRSARAAHPAQIRICTLRDMLRRRHHADFDEIERHLDHLDREVAQLLAIARSNDRTPVRITLTAHHEGDPAMADQFPANEPIVITADVENAEHVAVSDTLTWSTSAGTLTPDPSTLTATLTGAPLGDTTVSVIDPLGITADVTVTVVDNTPATISLSAALASATPTA
jgi:hypothetical protein